MFWNKKKENNTVETVDTKKPMNEIIEEIHKTFYTEVDRLLESAKIFNSLKTDKGELLSKAEKLSKLGFTSTQEVQESEIEKRRIRKLKEENANKKALIEAINYFSFKYPHYKFITEDSVKKICEKYNLIYGEVSNYIGTVPDKNLQEMLDFKIKDEDKAYLHITSHWRYSFKNKKTISHEQFLFHQSGQKLKIDNWSSFHRNEYVEISEFPLEICASQKDFNTKNMEIKDFKLSKIEIPDPVVLQPVLYKGVKYYLISTAWGIESKDELVVNQKMN